MASSSEIKRRLCVDIGGDSVKIGEFSYPHPGEVVLESFAQMETGLGDISTEDPVYQYTVMEIIRKLIVAKKYRTRDVNLSISGQNAFIRFVKVPAMTDDRERIQKLLNFEAMQNLPFPEKDVVFGSQIIEPENPDTGEAEAMFVIIRNSDADGIISQFEKIGRHVRKVEIAATACCNAGHFNLVGAQGCEMILSIGGRSSTLIFADGNKYFVRTFLTAGHTITQQIAKEFGIGYMDAEELKKKHGFVGLGGAYEEPESEVAATVSKIIRNVMTRLHGEIMRTINLYRTQHGNRPVKMYLTGGSSVMAYTPHFFSEKLRIPVEYLNPFQTVKIHSGINKEELSQVAHVFSEVVGLAMRDAVHCPVEINLIPEARKTQDAIRHKAPFFYASCLVLLFCLSVTYWNIARKYDDRQTLRKNSARKVKELTQIVNKVNENNGKLNGIRSEYDSVMALYGNRDFWVMLLNQIQQATPDGVWYTSIRGATAVQEVKAPEQKQERERGGGGGGFQGFGGMGMGGGGGEAKKTQTQDINYIVLKGYIIAKDQAQERNVIFNRLLEGLRVKDGLFVEELTENDEYRFFHNFKIDLYVNVSPFMIEMKLKKPVKK